MTRPLVNHLREPLGSLLSAFKTILLQSKQGFPLFLTTTLSESVNPRPLFSLLDMRIIYSKLSSVVKAVSTGFTTTTVETVLPPFGSWIHAIAFNERRLPCINNDHRDLNTLTHIYPH